jgi:hypothetical protein
LTLKTIAHLAATPQGTVHQFSLRLEQEAVTYLYYYLEDVHEHVSVTVATSATAAQAGA